MAEAAVRKAKEELGADVKLIMPLGFYEEKYDKTEQKTKGGNHSVTMVFLAHLLSKKIVLDDTSLSWKWMKDPPSKLWNTQPFNLIAKPKPLLHE